MKDGRRGAREVKDKSKTKIYEDRREQVRKMKEEEGKDVQSE